jgi:hypothetical protein
MYALETIEDSLSEYDDPEVWFEHSSLWPMIIESAVLNSETGEVTITNEPSYKPMPSKY